MKRRIILSGIFALALSTSAHADSIKDFYTGKTINVIVSTGPGTVFDIAARVIAKYMGNYIPGSPSIIVRNMPGAGHLRATQFMYAQAPRDGTYIATINNGIPLEQIVTGPSIRFDVREFGWLGSAGLSNLLTLSWHTSGVKNIEEAKNRQLIAGATGIASNGFLYANVMNTLVGTKFKIVSGYSTSGEADLAMERGEVSARAGFSLSAVKAEHPNWLRENKVHILFQTGLKREESLPNVPLMHELVKTSEQREVLMLLSRTVGLGRPFFAPPNVPQDRINALREAFAKTLQDPQFLVEAEQAQLDIRYMDWKALTELVVSIVDAPEFVVKMMRRSWGRESVATP